MDKLVAQYSRPAHLNEFYSEQEQQDLTESLPPLSLKFSLPPVDNVSDYHSGLDIQICGGVGHVLWMLLCGSDTCQPGSQLGGSGAQAGFSNGL